MTSDTFGDYLRLLRAHTPTDRTLYLVLDMHSSHRTPAVKDMAASLNIDLHFVPAGLTDALQPLGRTIFGALKSHTRRLFRCQVRDSPWLRRAGHGCRLGDDLCRNIGCRMGNLRVRVVGG
jgi:hypothetical protein